MHQHAAEQATSNRIISVLSIHMLYIYISIWKRDVCAEPVCYCFVLLVLRLLMFIWLCLFISRLFYLIGTRQVCSYFFLSLLSFSLSLFLFNISSFLFFSFCYLFSYIFSFLFNVFTQSFTVQSHLFIIIFLSTFVAMLLYLLAIIAMPHEKWDSLFVYKWK